MLVSPCMKANLLTPLFAAVLFLPAPIKADDTPLGRQMDSLDDAYKGFRRETDVVKGAEQARLAQEATVKSLSEVPELLSNMPDGPEKAKALSSYRQLMGELYVLLCKAEQAFLNDKADEVPALVDEMLSLIHI